MALTLIKNVLKSVYSNPQNGDEVAGYNICCQLFKYYCNYLFCFACSAEFLPDTQKARAGHVFPCSSLILLSAPGIFRLLYNTSIFDFLFMV